MYPLAGKTEPVDRKISPREVAGWILFGLVAMVTPFLGIASNYVDPWSLDYDPTFVSLFFWSFVSLPVTSLYCGIWTGIHIGEDFSHRVMLSVVGVITFAALNLMLLVLAGSFIGQTHFEAPLPPWQT